MQRRHERLLLQTGTATHTSARTLLPCDVVLQHDVIEREAGAVAFVAIVENAHGATVCRSANNDQWSTCDGSGRGLRSPVNAPTLLLEFDTEVDRNSTVVPTVDVMMSTSTAPPVCSSSSNPETRHPHAWSSHGASDTQAQRKEERGLGNDRGS
jgi:hypothetical protein